MKRDVLKEMETNILSWYDFKKDSKILYLGEKENGAYEYLKEKYQKVDCFEKMQKQEQYYDYVVVLEDKVHMQNILEASMHLKNEGIILLAFNNEYGISKFATYLYDSRKSELEDAKDEIGLEKLKETIEKEGYKYCNLYMPFPNYKKTDVILTEKVNDLSDKIEKYFLDYKEESVLLVDEINLLRKIANYDKELFVKLSNSYLLEISKQDVLEDVKYVSFNNYRKKEYQLTTIIKDDIVVKKPTTKEALKNIARISKNIEKLNKFDFEILDKFENDTLYSNLIKDKKTLDIELGLNFENIEFVLSKLNGIKEVLLKNSISYNKKDKKYYHEVLRKQEDTILEKLSYLEYGFYDMVPKNCFYIDNKYYFFDQEWMEYYLPVEFIVYRSVVNSYDLVRNINVDELLEKLGILEYKTIFEELDKSLRENIIDKERFEVLDKKYPKMYEIIYEHGILKKQNEDLRINDQKQNEYIKQLEANLNKN